MEQIVGYPILDLENFYTDIGKYLRELEEVVITTIAEYDLDGQRSKGKQEYGLSQGCQEKKGRFVLWVYVAADG
ncbi:MAG: hypothetical protein WKF59_00515 [Chitinophagaceae bacterium]